MSSFGREVVRIVAVDQPFCTREYGDAFSSPAGGCTAVLGIDGNRKCFNTRATCQDPANYIPGTLTLKFTQDQLDVPRYYGPVIPSLVDIDTTPLEVNLGGLDKSASALGQREIVTITLQDHKHSDLLVDKYRLERPTGSASVSTGGSPFGSPTSSVGGGPFGGSPIQGTIASAQGTVSIASTLTVGQTIDVTTDGAGQPLTGFHTATSRVIIFKWVGRGDVGESGGNSKWGTGFATSTTNRRSYTTVESNGITPSRCKNRWRNDAAICILVSTAGSTGNIEGLVDYNGEVTNGFQLVIDYQLANTELVGWWAIWGDELSVATLDFTSPATTGVVDYNVGLDLTGGANDKAVIFFGGSNVAVDTIGNDSTHMLGVAAGNTPTNAVLLTAGDDNVVVPATWSYCSTGECIANSTSADAVAERALVPSTNGWNSTGFRLNWLEVTAVAGLLRYSALVLKGPKFSVFDILSRTDTTQTDEVVGFDPLGIMVASHSRTQSSTSPDTTQAHAIASVGFATGATSRCALAYESIDAGAAVAISRALRTDCIYISLTSGIEDAFLDIVDMSVVGGGFTFVMDDTEPSQSFIWGLAVGQSDYEEVSGDGSVVVEEELQEITISGPGVYDPYERGTFWGKWLARNPYYTAYGLRVYEGYLGDDLEDMRIRHYILDKIDGPKDGAVKITARDLFSRIEAKKSVAPTASRGELSSAITALDITATLSPAGIGDLDYPAMSGSPSEFYVSIGDEIIKCSRSGNTLTLIERGAFNTIPQAHDEEDLVQWVLIYQSQSPHDIAYDLLVNYSEVPAANINFTEWDTLASSITDLFTAKIAEPTPVEELLGELAMQAGFTIWPDVSTGMIKFTPLRPGSVFPTVTDNEWIVEGSLSVTRQNNKRVSQVWVYYGQINPTESLEEAKNYSSRVVTVDPDAEDTDQYAEPAIMNVYSRWVPQFGRQSAERIGERLLAMFRDPPLEAKFNIHSSRDGELEIARYFSLETHDIQDDTGAEESAALATTSIERGLNEITITAQEVAFTEEITSEGASIRRVYIENDVTDLNLRTLHDTLFVAPLGGSPSEVVEFYVLAGVTVGSTSPSSPAITTGTWPSMSTLPLLVNEGRIQGMGGIGGIGGTASTFNPAYANNGNAGGTGGTALQATSAISLNNASGEIWGGGGGGGGGGGSSDDGFLDLGASGGSGGGGGAGINGGALGAGAIGLGFNLTCTGNSGSAGSATGGGSGGSAHNCGRAQTGGAGGSGGEPGLAGSAGSAGSGGALNGSGGSGGAAGKYIEGISLVTLVSSGDLRGSVS